MSVKLHPQLQADTYTLGQICDCTLLLHKNALIPWFILVPDTNENEIFKLTANHQAQINNATNQLAHFVESHFKTDKLNIATIGNIVAQLHIHIIGRFTDDFCWPAPVWGQADFAEYKEQDLLSIKQTLIDNKLIFI
ncbi:MAG: HIT family protein [endosymbiont of Galathealinum brachiosum]|uniref:HIT family protein n=1 Tax=endosymbiont of Galathealinum brachiosum TaxID=2200906 RepID=A0A370DC05_9GAMM|nr:MAG: HIT family protein [endosymbiont of Galathealinum brachiosum]